MLKCNFPKRKDPHSAKLLKHLCSQFCNCSEFMSLKTSINYILRDNCYQIIYGCKMLHTAETAATYDPVN